MYDESDVFKTVLLIDLDSIISHTKRGIVDKEVWGNLMRVSALKLLYAQFSQAKLKHQYFQWAYKIYSSSDCFALTRNKRRSKVAFQDLSLQNFEAFETNWESLISNLSDHSDLSTKKNLTFHEDPVDSIKKELYYVITNYPWSTGGFSSPVKYSTLKASSCARSSLNKLKRFTNMLYLFSPCPKSNDELEVFTGCNNMDASTLQNCLVPEELIAKYEEMQCCFCWVDLNIWDKKVLFKRL